MKINIPLELRHSSGIYEIRNLVNNKIYVGSTKSFIKRARGHKSSLYRCHSGCTRLQRSYTKYGADKFEFTVLCEVKRLQHDTDESFLDRLLTEEGKYISLLESNKRDKGFNIRIDPATNRDAPLGPRVRPEVVAVIKKRHSELPKLNIGSNSPLSLIDESTAKEVKLLLAKGCRGINIANFLGISASIVYAIKYRQSWGKVDVTNYDIESYTIPNLSKNEGFFLDISDVKLIKFLLHKGFRNRSVSLFVTGRKTIARHIEKGLAYPMVSLLESDIITFETSSVVNEFLEYLNIFTANKSASLKKSAIKKARLGSNCPWSKLNEDDVLQIKDLILAGSTLEHMANLFNVNFSHISHIKRGKAWAHLTGFDKNPPKPAKRNVPAKISEHEVILIKNALAAGECQKDLAQRLGISPAIVQGVASGKAWGSITGILYKPKKSLTSGDVLQIKELLWVNNRTAEIASKFNVSLTTIEDIKYGRTWREVTGFAHVTPGIGKGQSSHSAKLTDAKVLDIKARILNGESQASIARSVGISSARICSIKQGDAWAHITGFTGK